MRPRPSARTLVTLMRSMLIDRSAANLGRAETLLALFCDRASLASHQFASSTSEVKPALPAGLNHARVRADVICEVSL